MYLPRTVHDVRTCAPRQGRRGTGTAIDHAAAQAFCWRRLEEKYAGMLAERGSQRARQRLQLLAQRRQLEWEMTRVASERGSDRAREHLAWLEKASR